MKTGIITDIHENCDLLADSLRLAEKLGCDEIACLGDIVGYDRRFFDYDSKRDAGECVRLIRENCRWITSGNHDIHASGKLPSYSNGFVYPADWFRMNTEQRKMISGGKVWCYEGDSPNNLSDTDKEFLRKNPEFIITSEPGVTCLFSHYFAPDFTGSTTVYIEKKGQLSQHWNILSTNNVNYSFTGHSHNYLTGFAYRRTGIFSRAVHSFPGNIFSLDKEITAVTLPPLSGDKGKRGFTILDADNRQVHIINLY